MAGGQFLYCRGAASRNSRRPAAQGFTASCRNSPPDTLEGYPRVFGVAWAFVAHTDSRFDPETLRRFVTAYQRVQPLTIGELWAVAITLRVVLVENLRRMAERIVLGAAARGTKPTLADSLLGSGGQSLVAPADGAAANLRRSPSNARLRCSWCSACGISIPK